MHLVIETATAHGLLALCDDKGVIGEKSLPIGLSNSRTVEPLLKELFTESGRAPKELDFVAAGIGPGSYTGIRVGAACAKAIAYGCRIPLVGISSLRGFIPPLEYLGPYLVAIDARIGGIYTLLADKTAAGITFIGDDRLVSVDSFQELLGRVGYVVTPAWEPIRKRLAGHFLPKVFETGPSSLQLFIESKQKFDRKEYSMDGALTLAYLRLTQAEMEKGIQADVHPRPRP